MEFLEARRRAELRFDGRRCYMMCFPFGVKTHAASLARIKINFFEQSSQKLRSTSRRRLRTSLTTRSCAQLLKPLIAPLSSCPDQANIVLWLAEAWVNIARQAAIHMQQFHGTVSRSHSGHGVELLEARQRCELRFVGR